MALHNDMFNRAVLPAVLNDPTAGVNISSMRQIKFAVGFTWFDNPAMADQMLVQRTPLIVGVSIHGGRQRDHFIVIFKDAAGQNWAIDPWPGDINNAVVELNQDVTFTRSIKIHLTADEVNTEIPCGHPFFGYFK